MGERRTESRLLCADMVSVEWTDRHGRLRTDKALLEDISSLGFCLQTDYVLPENAVVLVDLSGTQVKATVRYCCWREIGYFTGLTFAPGYRWPRERFQPKHLTDPLRVARSCRVIIV